MRSASCSSPFEKACGWLLLLHCSRLIDLANHVFMIQRLPTRLARPGKTYVDTKTTHRESLYPSLLMPQRLFPNFMMVPRKERIWRKTAPLEMYKKLAHW